MSERKLPLVPIDDNLPASFAERWVITKMQIIQAYLLSFINQISSKKNEIVFVDLFAGNGVYALGNRKQLFFGSGMTAMSLNLPINKFVLCESDPEELEFLKIRASRYFKKKTGIILSGNPSELLSKIKMYVPSITENFSTSVFCVSDPFSLEMSFETVCDLAHHGFTFLIPFTIPLNEQIGYKHYLGKGREKLKSYVGGEKNVAAIEKNCKSNQQFYKKLVRTIEQNLKFHGLRSSLSLHKVDSGLMTLPYFYIGLFSMTEPVEQIGQEIQNSSGIQFDLFEDE